MEQVTHGAGRKGHAGQVGVEDEIERLEFLAALCHTFLQIIRRRAGDSQQEFCFNVICLFC